MTKGKGKRKTQKDNPLVPFLIADSVAFGWIGEPDKPSPLDHEDSLELVALPLLSCCILHHNCPRLWMAITHPPPHGSLVTFPSAQQLLVATLLQLFLISILLSYRAVDTNMFLGSTVCTVRLSAVCCKVSSLPTLGTHLWYEDHCLLLVGCL